MNTYIVSLPKDKNEPENPELEPLGEPIDLKAPWLMREEIEINPEVGSFANSLPCHGSTSFRIGSRFRCIRSTPTEMESTSESDFECFAAPA